MLFGAVLAGGRSSRMGQDKALLELDGQSLLERAVMLLKSVGCDQILVSRNQPGFIQDSLRDKGPLGAVYSLLNAAQGPSQWLIIPVDMPALTVELMQLLVAAGQQHQQACYFNSSPLPLYLPDGQAAARAVDYLLQQDRLAVQGLLSSLHARGLPCNHPQQLENLNYPGDWQRFSRQPELN